MQNELVIESQLLIFLINKNVNKWPANETCGSRGMGGIIVNSKLVVFYYVIRPLLFLLTLQKHIKISISNTYTWVLYQNNKQNIITKIIFENPFEIFYAPMFLHAIDLTLRNRSIKISSMGHFNYTEYRDQKPKPLYFKVLASHIVFKHIQIRIYICCRSAVYCN